MSDETAIAQKKLIHDLKVNELRAELEKRSLDKTGVKATLIERLEKALKNEGHDVITFVFNAELTSEGDATDSTATAAPTAVVSVNSEKTPEVAGCENANVKNTDVSKAVDDSTVGASPNNAVESAERDHIVIGSPVDVFPSGNDATPTAQLQNADNSVVTSTEPTTTTSTAPATTNAGEKMNTSELTTTLNEPPALTATAGVAKTPIETDVPVAEPAKAVDNNDTTSMVTATAIVLSDTNAPVAPVKTEQILTAKKSANDLAASVWIRGISNSTKAADLKTLFSKHGKVIAAKIFTTKNKLAPTCFGYITMADVDAANLCIQKLNRTNLKGKVITVEKISKAGKIAASALNTTTAELAASANASEPAVPLKTQMAAKATPSNEKIAMRAATTSASATGGESPEIIFEDVRTKSAASDNGEKTEDNAQMKDAGSQQSASGKKAVRPRIVASKDSTAKVAPRKIRPPVESSAPKVNHATRTAKNISRRVINTSNTRFRSAATSHTISRVGYKSSAVPSGPVRRFGARAVGSNGGVRVFNGPVRPGYRKPLVGPGPRFTTRPMTSSSTSYDRAHHSGAPVGRGTLSSSAGGAKISSWERNELLMTMRQREDEYRKKEEELKLQRERERLKFERERLEREKLEIQQMKLTAQLASAQMALIPGAAGGNAVTGYDAGGVFNKLSKSSSSTSKKHSDGGAGDSRRGDRGREPIDRRPSSKTQGRTRSRSRSPHQHGASFKRGGATNYTRGRPTAARYSDSSSKARYDGGTSHHSSSAKHQSSSYSSRGASVHRGTSSSRDRPRVSTGDSLHSSRFGYGGDGNSPSYARGYASGSNTGRNQSPVRRGNTNRSAGGRDSYASGGIQRFIDDGGLQSVSQYIARTDPSYASRVTGSGGVGSGSSMGVSADEMFGLTGGSSGAAAVEYFSGSRLSSGDGYHDSIPSTYQATLSTAGSSGALPWNSGGGSGGRSNYLNSQLDTTNNWQSSSYQAVSRSDWDNNYVSGSGSGGGQHYASGNRYSSGNGSYNSRRY